MIIVTRFNLNYVGTMIRPFCADYFASYRSWCMKLFYARFGCGESKGVDVFTFSWDRGFGYIYPPMGLIWKLVRQAEKTGARGLLVTPD